VRAMLHYALLKSARERSLWAFLFAPMMLIAAPLLGFAGHAVLEGRPAWPVVLEGMSLANSERSYIVAAAAAAVAAAAAAAFWCFRSDVADRSLSFMLLALPRPVVAPLTAALFGWCCGMIAFALTLPVVGLATGLVTRAWLPATLAVAVAAVAASAMGIAFAAWSPVPGTLVMVVWMAMIAAGVTSAFLHDAPLPVIATSFAAAGIFIVLAARGMERRCAA
jgi:hypothetical protein